MGYTIGLTSSTLSGPSRILQWAPKFARKQARSSLGGEACVSCEMVGNLALPREFCARLSDASPGAIGPWGNESLFTHLRRERAVVEKFPVRHFSGTQQAPCEEDLGNVFWPSGTENPTGGLARAKSGFAPQVRTRQSSSSRPGALRLLRRLLFKEDGSG